MITYLPSFKPPFQGLISENQDFKCPLSTKTTHIKISLPLERCEDDKHLHLVIMCVIGVIGIALMILVTLVTQARLSEVDREAEQLLNQFREAYRNLNQ